MNQNELIQLIKNGESPCVEFKEEGIKPNDLAAEMVAFSNYEGGIILLGISDDGEPKGVIDQNVEEKIMNIARNNCIPGIVPVCEKMQYIKKNIIIITIPKGLNKPYYTSDNKYYIRVGTTKRIASREELLRLFEASGSFHFDISPVYNTSLKDIDLDKVRDYFLKYNMFDLYEESEETVVRILINADILKEESHKTICTVGGLLIFGKAVENKLPQSGISFAHFSGNDITEELIDKKNINGTLPDILEQATVVIKNNIKSYSKIENLKRVEKEEYPSLVLREAMVNALVHRNYSILGSKVRILMFENRIEFHSPGRLPNTVTIEKMKVGVSYARNPFLVKYMENLRYIDQLGRGIPMIIKTMKNVGAIEPKLEVSGDEFILTIYKSIENV